MDWSNSFPALPKKEKKPWAVHCKPSRIKQGIILGPAEATHALLGRAIAFSSLHVSVYYLCRLGHFVPLNTPIDRSTKPAGLYSSTNKQAITRSRARANWRKKILLSHLQLIQGTSSCFQLD
jgi:hypothetical protein